ncbi:MAG: hypothetical protein ACTHML_07665 [Ginsengibacter sp.]
MRLIFILMMLFLGAQTCLAQNDLLLLKKNNRTVKSFYPGTHIDFSTDSRYYEAQITGIKKDSLFLVQYEVRRVYSTMLGLFVLDTVAVYPFAINYKEITSIGKEGNKFNWSASGATLFGGGVLLTTAGLLTWVFSKPNTRYYASPQLVIGAAALAGIGYLLLKTGNKPMKLGKKYTLHYIEVK